MKVEEYLHENKQKVRPTATSWGYDCLKLKDVLYLLAKLKIDLDKELEKQT